MSRVRGCRESEEVERIQEQAVKAAAGKRHLYIRQAAAHTARTKETDQQGPNQTSFTRRSFARCPATHEVADAAHAYARRFVQNPNVLQNCLYVRYTTYPSRRAII